MITEVDKQMVKEYSEVDKAKYCVGFKKCTLPITDYAEKMGINVEDLKQWLKEYKEPPAFGAIDVASLLETPTKQITDTNFKFTSDTIKIEIAENYDSNVLMKIIDLMKVMCNVK